MKRDEYQGANERGEETVICQFKIELWHLTTCQSGFDFLFFFFFEENHHAPPLGCFFATEEFKSMELIANTISKTVLGLEEEGGSCDLFWKTCFVLSFVLSFVFCIIMMGSCEMVKGALVST